MAGIGPPTPMPEVALPSQHVAPDATSAPTADPAAFRPASAAGDMKYPLSAEKCSLEDLTAPPKEEMASAQSEEPQAALPAVFASPKLAAAVSHPLSGRVSRPASSSSRPRSREGAMARQDLGLPPQPAALGTKNNATVEVAPPSSRPPSRPGSRPSSRPPSQSSSRPGSRSEKRLSSQPVPLGSDPLGALAASRQQTPKGDAALATPAGAAIDASLPPCLAPVRAPSSASDTLDRQRAHSSQPPVRATQSAEGMRRAGSMEAPQRRGSWDGSGQKVSRSGIESMSSPPPPAAGWASGEDLSSSMSQTMRRRAEKVAADQQANTKEREDSLLRMLDNRQQQRQRAVL